MSDAPIPADPPRLCDRCGSAKLRFLSSPTGTPYVLCRGCGHEFESDGIGGKVTRGLPPLKIVVAGLVFTRSLDGAAPRMAQSLRGQFTSEELHGLVGEIRDALGETGIDLAAKLDLPHLEVDIRAFLARLAKLLEA